MLTNQESGITALGDATRRAIFELLADGPRPVGEIAKHLPVTRPAVSQHLKVLKEAGLVIDRQDGTKRLYQLNPAGLAELRAYFDRFWNQALNTFKQAAEQRVTEPRDTEQRNTEQRDTEQRNTEQRDEGQT